MPVRTEPVGHTGSDMDVVWGLAAAVGFAALAWYGFGREAHWVASDGRAFTCEMARVGPDGQPVGRWRQARAYIESTELILRPRPSLDGRAWSAHCRVLVRTEDDNPRWTRFGLDGQGLNQYDLVWIRLPAHSAAVVEIESILAAPGNGPG